MVLTVQQIKSAVPNITDNNIEKYLFSLNQTFAKYQIDTPLRIAHFLSQVGHESASFAIMSENLNYSIQGLLKTFPKYFKTSQIAKQYARQPIKIASKVYANRLGNGNELSGDGWNYRGKGAIQITGKSNHYAYGQSINVDLISHPELLLTIPYVIDCAGWYFSVMKLMPICDADDCKLLTKRINGGFHGLDDRYKRLLIAKKALGI